MDTLHLFHELETLLRMDDRYCMDDGTLIKNNIVEDALSVNPKLIKYLLSHDGLKNTFFREVEGVLVFDKVKFQRFVMNKSFLADSYTSFKNKIGLTDEEGRFISESREVVLSWPYKDCMLEGGQTKEDAKRDEIFWNETLAPDEINRLTEPKVFTNFKRYDKEGEHNVEHLLPNDNLIIKGNNLFALHSLKKRFPKGVNLIYIDPPFNTDNDSFSYNDKFTRSTWLTFMRNRLFIARDLLTDDGNIFIHIDINQSHYLKVLCDEVFKEDNLIEEIIWAYGSPSGGRAASAKPVNIHDYILHYAKDKGCHKQKHVYTPYSEKYIQDWFKYTDEEGRRYRIRQRGDKNEGDDAWKRQYLDESKGIPLSSVWTDIMQVYANPMAYKEGNTADVEVIKEFKGGQKPEALVARILEMCSDENDLVLDFHLGTGTTAAAAMKMKRRYIGIEQLDSQIDIILKRLPKVIKGDKAGISKQYNWQGGGSFVYCELAKSNSHFIDEIESVKTTVELKAIWDRMKATDYLNYKVLPSEIDANVTDFEALSLDDQKRFLMECLDKNLLYVPLSDIDSNEYAVSEEDKRLTREFYAKK